MKSENVLIIFSILVLAVLLMNIFSSSGGSDAQSLNYSDFVNQVREGNIVTATIIGNTSIEGNNLDGSMYQTNIPPQNPNLVNMLREHKVQVSSVPEAGMPWYLSLLIHWGPFIFIFAIWILLMRRMQGPAGRLFHWEKAERSVLIRANVKSPSRMLRVWRKAKTN